MFEEESFLVELVTGTADCAEGMAAFRDRRPIAFRGF